MYSFFWTKSSKCDVYFTLTSHLNSDNPISYVQQPDVAIVLDSAALILMRGILGFRKTWVCMSVSSLISY